MTPYQRRFKLAIWGLALGYFAFYVPYAALIKIVTNGFWPGVRDPVSGFSLLPSVALSTALALTAIVSVNGWWKHAGRRHVFGLNIPFPRPLVVLSGAGTAVIIATTTLIFTFKGISIVLALVLMRSGVLILAPVVDRVFRRRVRWFSWAACLLAVPAVLLSLADVKSYRLSMLAVAMVIGYLSGYLLRLPCATKLAKSRETAANFRYFVEEQVVASVLLVAIPGVLALIGKGEIMLELREGFAGLFTSNVTVPGFIIGALYAGLYCFGTFIYLDCRENTFCIPLNRASSLLAGFLASLLIGLFLGLPLSGLAQVGSAALLFISLIMLSPFHHAVENAFNRFNNLLAHGYLRLRGVASARPLDPAPQRLILFVCSGNTCRSPMAAAIANAQIAARLGIPSDDLQTVNVRAMSAGIAAKVGAPLTPEAIEVLQSLNVPVGPHAARNLTAELADQAALIFCMSSAHRRAVLDMIPSAAAKTYCLDPDGDIADPIGLGLAAYVRCARQIQSLVRLRFDQLGISGQLPV